MDKYEIALSRDKRHKSFRMLGWIIVFLNYFVLIYLAIARPDSITTWTIAIISAILLVFISIRRERQDTLKENTLLLARIIAIPAWLVFGFPLLSIANAILLALAVLVSKKLIIKFNKEFIAYPSFPIRKLSWIELQNVVLKDGILTIDFQDNKLLQRDIDESIFRVNEQEFNDFCRAQLKK